MADDTNKLTHRVTLVKGQNYSLGLKICKRDKPVLVTTNEAEAAKRAIFTSTIKGANNISTPLNEPYFKVEELSKSEIDRVNVKAPKTMRTRTRVTSTATPVARTRTRVRAAKAGEPGTTEAEDAAGEETA